jgi:hypothetical protein
MHMPSSSVRSAAATIAATAGLLLALAAYLLPALTTSSVDWHTHAYGLALGPSDHYRWPGYLWPAAALCLYALALLPYLLPRALSGRPMVLALGRVATFLLILVALFLLQWLVVTPLFS